MEWAYNEKPDRIMAGVAIDAYANILSVVCLYLFL